MADVFTKAKRSEVMSHIKGKGIKATEVTLVKLWRANQIIGWCRHYAIEGKPDFAFQRHACCIR